MSAENTSSATIAVVLGGTAVPLPDNQTLNGFTVSGADTQFTVPATGDYLVSYAVATTVALAVSSEVLRNGTAIPASIIAPVVNVDNLSTSFIVSLNAGDTLTLELFGLLGAAVTLGGASTYMTAVRLS